MTKKTRTTSENTALSGLLHLEEYADADVRGALRMLADITGYSVDRLRAAGAALSGSDRSEAARAVLRGRGMD